MKTQSSKLSILIWLVFFAQPLFATDYYFSDQSGDDSRSAAAAQNPSTPWKSIEKLNTIFSTLNPGDAVYFKRGEKYYGTIHIDKSGTSGNPIKIGAYGSGSKPIITSFIEIENWNGLSNNQFESVSALKTSDVQVVLVNGKRVELGRFPNGDQDNEGYITITSVTDKNSISGDFPAGSSNWLGAQVVIKKMQWVIDSHKVTAHSSNNITFDSESSSYIPKIGFGFFIQNHPNTLDKYGEWYFNPSTKKIRLHFGNEKPADALIEYASLPYLITKSSRANHIVVENLHLSGANKDAIYFSSGDDVRISKVDIDFTGEDGMHILSHTNLVIEECMINDAYNNGMFLRFGNNGAVIKYNNVSNIATEAGRTRNGDGAGVGIFAVSDNTLIERNSVNSVGYNGIQFNGNNTIVKNNFIDTFCLIKGDGGGIYTYGGHNNSDVHNRKVIQNTILNGIGSKGGLAYINRSGFNPQAEGIFLDDNSNGIEIIGNNISNANSGIKMSNSYNVKVTNNTIYNSNLLLNVGNSDIGKDTRNITVESNTLFSKFADQNAYTIRSHKDDILQMVSFKNNGLFRPFGDNYSINTRHSNSSGTFTENLYNLESWTRETGNDIGSTNPTVEFEKFIIQERTSNNLFPNMEFNSNTSGLSGNNSTLTWVKDEINGGTLQISPNSNASLKIDIGKVVKDRTYLVKFKAKAEKPVPIRVNLRHTGSPWEIISTRITFDLETTTKEYQTILTSATDIDKASLMMSIPESGVKIWLDDLEILSVNVKQVEPEDKILFEYNHTSTTKTLPLNSTYVDAKNISYSGKILIAPFSSVVLFKLGDDAEITTEPIQPPVAPEVVESLAMNIGSSESVTFEGEVYDGENLSYFISPTTESLNETASSEPLFQTGRFGSSMNISIPITNGIYTVKTLHHETYFGLNGISGGPGQRVFDVSIQGNTVKKDFDLFLENANQETVLTFEKIEVVNGMLTLNLTASVNNAIISGIFIAKFDETAEIKVSTSNDDVIKETIAATAEPLPSFNTFNRNTVVYNGQEFTGEGSKYLKSPDTGISNNTLASTEELFQSARFATELTYEIPVPNGKYTVKTYHHETYFGVSGPAARKNQRVFDIIIEGKIVKEKMDMFVEFGNKEIELTFREIEVTDQILHIDLKSSINNAIISGITISAMGEESTELVEKSPVFVEESTATNTKTTGLYFSTGNQGSVTYLDAKFDKIPSRYLLSLNTNVSKNTDASIEPLFQGGRFGKKLSYSIPVPDGIYTVETYHKETYFGFNGRKEGIGQRVFDILIEGQMVKASLDMFAEFQNKELKLEFKSIKVTDGQLNIDLNAIANNAIISGIGIMDETGKVLLINENLRGFREMETQELEFEEPQQNKNNVAPILYPNPAKEFTNLSIQSEQELQILYIHNMGGQLIKALDPSQYTTAPGIITIPTSDIKDGLYLITVVDAKGNIVKLRLIVQH